MGVGEGFMPGDVFSSTHPAQEAREDKVSVGETGGGSFSGGKEGENKYVSVCKDVCLESFFFLLLFPLFLSFGTFERWKREGGAARLIGRYCFLLVMCLAWAW